MTNQEELRAGAEQYVDDQLAVMAKYGSARALTSEERERMILKIIKVVRAARGEKLKEQGR